MLASGWWPFTITIISLVGPFLFQQIRKARREDAADEDQPSKSGFGRPIISLLLLSNTTYILYSILITPPPNLFTGLRIPFTTPAPTIRALLLQHTNPPSDMLPNELELLITKLASFEVRTLYARYDALLANFIHPLTYSRFGHNAITGCIDCESFLQFGLYAVAAALLDYIRNILLYGLVTMRGTGRERLRLLGTGALVLAAAFEAWWIATVDIQVPRDGLGVVMVSSIGTPCAYSNT